MNKDIVETGKIRTFLFGRQALLEFDKTSGEIVVDDLSILLKETLSPSDYLAEVIMATYATFPTGVYRRPVDYTYVYGPNDSTVRVRTLGGVTQCTVDNESDFEGSFSTINALMRSRQTFRPLRWYERDDLLDAILRPQKGDYFRGRVCILQPEVRVKKVEENSTPSSNNTVVIKGTIKCPSHIASAYSPVDDHVAAAVLFCIQLGLGAVSITVGEEVLMVNINRGTLRWLDEDRGREFSKWAIGYLEDVATGYYYDGRGGVISQEDRVLSQLARQGKFIETDLGLTQGRLPHLERNK